MLGGSIRAIKQWESPAGISIPQRHTCQDCWHAVQVVDAARVMHEEVPLNLGLDLGIAHDGKGACEGGEGGAVRAGRHGGTVGA